MSVVIKMIYLVLASVLMMVMMANISVQARAVKFIKEDLEIAVHDAALQQNKTELAKGKFVFDKDKALTAFKDSIKANTGIPESNYDIIEFKIFDDSNSTFPVSYKSDKVKFEDVFSHPTILVVWGTTTNKYFIGGTEQKIVKVASYSYAVDTDREQLTSSESMVGLEANKNGLYWAVPYTKNITSGFDPNRVSPTTGEVKAHNGIDIASSGVQGKPVVSAQDGTVVYAGVMNGYGNLVIVDHGGGFETRYGHLESYSVATGDKVKGGQVIGAVGNTGDSTGYHLHFETRMNGTSFDPLTLY